MLTNLISYICWRLFAKKSRIKKIIDADDARIYCEVYGNGKPIVLLPGGLTSIETWFAQLPTFSKQFKVIAIDTRGHGRSTLGNKPFSYRLLADDVIQVLDSLNIPKADIIGWSDGGNIGLRLAVDYPARINRLVAISANYHPDGLTNNVMEDLMTPLTSNYSFASKLIYRFIAPDPSAWNALCQQVQNMWATRPQISIQDLKNINAQTLLIQGENDFITNAHFLEMIEHIPHTKQLIIPKVGHNLLQKTAKSVTQAVIDYLT